MAVGKQAFFLTFISVMMVSFFILVFATSSTIRTPESSDNSWAKVDTADRFTKDLKKLYLEKALIASSKAAFRSMTNYTMATKRNMSDIQANFTELILHGTLSGMPQPAMENMTLPNWSRQIQNLSYENLRIRTNISYLGFEVTQHDPWTVTVSGDFFITTNLSGVVYRIATTTEVNISIIGWYDPLFLMNGSNRTIIPTNISPYNWTVDTALEHLKAGHFRRNAYGLSPSYLMRFANNLSGSACCGIESLVNGSFGVYNRSYVDYKFWNGTEDLCLAGPLVNPVYFVPGLTDYPAGFPENFRLDKQDFVMYTNLTVSPLNFCQP